MTIIGLSAAVIWDQPKAGCTEEGHSPWPAPRGSIRRSRSRPGSAFQRQFPVLFSFSWLRVSGTTEMPQIDQCVGHQFHTVVSLLFELKAQQQPLEFIFPRESPLHA